MTSSQQDYIDLHRHAAVRARMIGEPSLCLRVAVAHMIAGSPLWTLRTEPQRAADAIAESVENSASEAQFDAERRRLLAVLGFDPDTPTITGGSDGLTSLYARLCTLDDATLIVLGRGWSRPDLPGKCSTKTAEISHFPDGYGRLWKLKWRPEPELQIYRLPWFANV